MKRKNILTGILMLVLVLCVAVPSVMAEDYIGHKKRTEHKKGVQGGYGLPLIEKDRLTIGDLFQDNGYATAAIGKWHVGMEWTLKQGFDREDQEEETVDHEAPLKITPNDFGFDYLHH